MITFLIRVGAAVVNAYHVATVIAAEAILTAVADLADHMPGHNDEQRVASLVIVLYATVALFSVAAVGGVLILSLLEIRL